MYFTPKIPNLYLLKCRQYDGVIKLPNLLTHLRNGRFWWEDSEISQNAMAFIGNMSNSEGNSRNFPFDNTLNVNCCTEWDQR